MNLPDITVGDGAVLTGALIEGKFDTVTQHQLTGYDHVDDIPWGGVADFDGGGILALRYLNGTIADSRYFRDGDDADAIQAAINWVAATTEGQGLVYLPPLGTSNGYSIDKQIVCATRVSVMGSPGTRLSLDFNGYAFFVGGMNGITFQDLVLDGNQRTSGVGLVQAGSDCTNIRVLRCTLGEYGNESASRCDGYLLNTGAFDAEHCVVDDCRCYGGGGFISADGGDHIVVRNCRFEDPSGGNTQATSIIDLDGCDHVLIEGNYGYLYNAGSADDPDRFIHLDTCEYFTVRGNVTYGAKLATVKTISCVGGSVRGNEFYSGATTAAGGDDVIVFVDDSSHVQICDNTITGIDELDPGLPIAFIYSVALSNVTNYGTVDSTNCVVKNNLFSNLTDSSTNPPTGEYRNDSNVAGGCSFDSANDHVVHGNTCIQEQYGLNATYSAGSSATAISADGFQSGLNAAHYRIMICPGASATAQDVMKIVGYGTNQFTIDAADGAPFSDGAVNWLIDF